MYLRNKESGNVKKRTIQKHKPNNTTTTSKEEIKKKLKTMKTEISKFEIYENKTKIKTQKTTKTEMRTFIIKWRLT